MDTVVFILLIVLFLIAAYFMGANIAFFNKARKEGNVCDLIYYWVIIISVVIIVS